MNKMKKYIYWEDGKPEVMRTIEARGAMECRIQLVKYGYDMDHTTVLDKEEFDKGVIYE